MNKCLKITVCFILAIWFESCLMFPKPSDDFESIYIELKNGNSNHYDSTQSTCNAPSMDVTFVIDNLDQDTVRQLKLSLSPADRKYININSKKDERLLVRLLKTANDSLIFEKKVSIGSTKFMGGDPAAKVIKYCSAKELEFYNF